MSGTLLLRHNKNISNGSLVHYYSAVLNYFDFFKKYLLFRILRQARMFEQIMHDFRLRQLQKHKRQIEAAFDKKIKEVRAKKDSNSEDSLFAEMFYERDEIDDAIYTLLSRRVLELANQYLIPLPDFNTESKNWVRSKIDGRYRLSETSISNLRSAIRKEKKEKHELFFMWLAGLTGVFGTLTGLFSILNR